MYKMFIIFSSIISLVAAYADEELADISDIYMGLVEAECTNVKSANVIIIKGLGEVAIIGVREASRDDNYYYDAVKLLKRRLLKRTVKIEVCPNIPMNDKSQVRAVVYYNNGGKWLNVGIELIEEGLARVALVPSCHVDTKVYLSYEKEARKAGRGLWKDWNE